MDSTSRVINSLIEYNDDELQALQDSFCAANDLYMRCVGRNSGTITDFSGGKLEEEFVEQLFSAQLRKEIVDSFIDGGAENVVERYGLKEYAMYRGVAIRGDMDSIVGVWLIFGLNADAIPDDEFISSEVRRTTKERFDKATSLLETLTRCYFAEKIKSGTLKKQLLSVEANDATRERKLHKNEVITDVLRMMESDNPFSKVADDILSISGRYLNVTSAFLFQIDNDGVLTDIVNEWCLDSKYGLMDELHRVYRKQLPFMTGRPYTISSDTTLPDDFEAFFKKYSIDAGIFLPVELNNRTVLYLCFAVMNDNRQWSIEDLKFANDIKSVIHSILVKRVTKNSLTSSYQALELILENTGCGVAVTDVEKREILFTNSTFEDMFKDEIDRLAVDEMFFDKSGFFNGNSNYSATNSGKWYDVTSSEIDWVDGRPVRLMSFYDITELKSYQRKVENQANEDYLTNLKNRQKCERDVEAEVNFCVKSDNECALLMMDLDDFGNVNEALGHDNGDMLLKSIAHALNGISDIQGKVYRVGGDEFLILVDHTCISKLTYIEKRILNLFDHPWIVDEREFYCTMSMGGVRAPEDDTNMRSLMAKLNATCRLAKKHGKNRNHLEYYSKENDTDSVRRLDLEAAMRTAVSDGCDEFEVYYQPLINIGVDGAPCCGAEALVRWNSKELGYITPDQFIPLAEYLGLIIPIGEHVLNEACVRCKYWNDFGHPEYKVNVNLSVEQLKQPNIEAVVENALNKSGLNPHNLTLEVTETLAVGDLDQMVSVLNRLRDLGCRIALDDFGTGYSSLNHIRTMPIDTIKIDKDFIKDLGTDTFSEAFVSTVSSLADTLKMDVCVEGIEKQSQRDVVARHAVNLMQGYYYDVPLKVSDFEKKYLI